MPDRTILILGGYGNAGRAIAKLALQHTHASIIVAGRRLKEAQNVVADLLSTGEPERVTARHVDATWSLERLKNEAFAGVDMVVVASSTTAQQSHLMQAALDANIDYYDIMLCRDEAMWTAERKARLEKSGRIVITEGGYHPGIPAALVRHAAITELHQLSKANLYVFVQPDWKALKTSMATQEEFMLEVNRMDSRIFQQGKWEPQGFSVQRDFDFGEEYKTQTCVPAYMDELGHLPTTVGPSLQELGMYIAGFNLVTIFLIMPLCMIGMWLFPKWGSKPLSKLFVWSLETFTQPPYGSVIALDAYGNDKTTSAPTHLSIRVAHKDSYLLTAVPVVACLKQILDETSDTSRKYGLHRQAWFVETPRFLEDMEDMGLSIEIRKELVAQGTEDPVTQAVTS